MSTEAENDNENVLETELETLEAIYINELTYTRTTDGRVATVELPVHPATGHDTSRQFVCMTLVFSLTSLYPNEAPGIAIRNPRGLGEEEIASLVTDMVLKAEELRGEAMLYTLIEMAKDSITDGNIPHCPCVVCLEHFQGADSFHRTSCYHYFHTWCLVQYLGHARDQLESDQKEASERRHLDLSSNDRGQVKGIICPVCRSPLDESSLVVTCSQERPEESKSIEKFEIPASWREQRQKMAELFEQQKTKGGIIDLEHEKNKFLVNPEDRLPIPVAAPAIPKAPDKTTRGDVRRPDNTSSSRRQDARRKNDKSHGFQTSRHKGRDEVITHGGFRSSRPYSDQHGQNRSRQELSSDTERISGISNRDNRSKELVSFSKPGRSEDCQKVNTRSEQEVRTFSVGNTRDAKPSSQGEPESDLSEAVSGIELKEWEDELPQGESGRTSKSSVNVGSGVRGSTRIGGRGRGQTSLGKDSNRRHEHAATNSLKDDTLKLNSSVAASSSDEVTEKTLASFGGTGQELARQNFVSRSGPSLENGAALNSEGATRFSGQHFAAGEHYDISNLKEDDGTSYFSRDDHRGQQRRRGGFSDKRGGYLKGGANSRRGAFVPSYSDSRHEDRGGQSSFSDRSHDRHWQNNYQHRQQKQQQRPYQNSRERGDRQQYWQPLDRRRAEDNQSSAPEVVDVCSSDSFTNAEAQGDDDEDEKDEKTEIPSWARTPSLYIQTSRFDKCDLYTSEKTWDMPDQEEENWGDFDDQYGMSTYWPESGEGVDSCSTRNESAGIRKHSLRRINPVYTEEELRMYCVGYGVPDNENWDEEIDEFYFERYLVRPKKRAEYDKMVAARRKYYEDKLKQRHELLRIVDEEERRIENEMILKNISEEGPFASESTADVIALMKTKTLAQKSISSQLGEDQEVELQGAINGQNRCTRLCDSDNELQNNEPAARNSRRPVRNCRPLVSSNNMHFTNDDNVEVEESIQCTAAEGYMSCDAIIDKPVREFKDGLGDRNSAVTNGETKQQNKESQKVCRGKQAGQLHAGSDERKESCGDRGHFMTTTDSARTTLNSACTRTVMTSTDSGNETSGHGRTIKNSSIKTGCGKITTGSGSTTPDYGSTTINSSRSTTSSGRTSPDYSQITTNSGCTTTNSVLKTSNYGVTTNISRTFTDSNEMTTSSCLANTNSGAKLNIPSVKNRETLPPTGVTSLALGQRQTSFSSHHAYVDSGQPQASYSSQRAYVEPGRTQMSDSSQRAYVEPGRTQMSDSSQRAYVEPGRTQMSDSSQRAYVDPGRTQMSYSSQRAYVDPGRTQMSYSSQHTYVDPAYPKPGFSETTPVVNFTEEGKKLTPEAGISHNRPINSVQGDHSELREESRSKPQFFSKNLKKAPPLTFSKKNDRIKVIDCLANQKRIQ